MATLKLGSTTAISESSGAITYDAGTIGSNIVFPAGHIVKISSIHDNNDVAIAANDSGGEVLDFDFTALKSNSAYYLSVDIASCHNTTSTSSDNGDRAYTGWLEDASGGNRYRFGYRRTSGQRHPAIGNNNDSYYLWDSDGGTPSGATWNQVQHSFHFIPGNQSNYKNSTVVSSAFSAGSTITLKIHMATRTGGYYNRSNMTTSASQAYSHYSVIEVAT